MEWVQWENISKYGGYNNINYALFEALKPVYVYCEICGWNKQEWEHWLWICWRYAA